MNFDFPPDTLLLRDMLRRFVQKEARPLESRFFTSGELALEERDRLRKAVEQLGLWGLMVPLEFGGGGLDLVTACVIEEELGKTFIPIETGDVFPLLYASNDSQVSNYLEPALSGTRRAILAASEPCGDNDLHSGCFFPKDWTTVVTKEDGDYLLDGKKILSAKPGPGDFLILLVNLPEGPTAFLLNADNPGLNITNDQNVVLTLNECRVSNEAILGEPGTSLAWSTDHAQRASIRMGARYVGICERLLEMALEHAKNWVSLGAALSLRPAIQRMLAEMNVEIECSRWLVYHAAWMVDEEQVESLRTLSAQVRLATGEMLHHAVDRVTMIFAGPGPAPQIEAQRFVRTINSSKALKLALEHARAILAYEMIEHPNI